MFEHYVVAGWCGGSGSSGGGGNGSSSSGCLLAWQNPFLMSDANRRIIYQLLYISRSLCDCSLRHSFFPPCCTTYSDDHEDLNIIYLPTTTKAAFSLLALAKQIDVCVRTKVIENMHYSSCRIARGGFFMVTLQKSAKRKEWKKRLPRRNVFSCTFTHS